MPRIERQQHDVQLMRAIEYVEIPVPHRSERGYPHQNPSHRCYHSRQICNPFLRIFPVDHLQKNIQQNIKLIPYPLSLWAYNVDKVRGILNTYHVAFVSGAVVDRVNNAVRCNQEHGQMAQPSMVAHSVLKRHMDQAQYRRSSCHRDEE